MYSFVLYVNDTHEIELCSANFFQNFFFVRIKIRIWAGSGSWYHFGFPYQTYILYIEDTYPILFGFVNSFESYCVYMKSPRTYSQTTRQTDRQTDRRTFFLLVLFSKAYKTWTFVKRREFFFSLMRLQYFLFLHTPYVIKKLKRKNNYSEKLN